MHQFIVNFQFRHLFDYKVALQIHNTAAYKFTSAAHTLRVAVLVATRQPLLHVARPILAAGLAQLPRTLFAFLAQVLADGGTRARERTPLLENMCKMRNYY